MQMDIYKRTRAVLSKGFMKWYSTARSPLRYHRVIQGSNYWTAINLSGACLDSMKMLRRRHPTLSSWIHSRSFNSMDKKIVRDLKFSSLRSEDIDHFKSILGVENVIMDEDKLVAANTDWMHKYKGSSKLLLRPRSTEEVSQILSYCNTRCLAVVPQGGNTGLVGGSVPVFDEVVINVGSMNKIISLDKVSGILVCEAGCILENLISFLDNERFVMPLDLGVKGSCQIGGNVSTNAGGLRLLRYGSLHGNVLGMEAVVADGTVLDMLRVLRKDNTGYDLKHLFIGSEGTLGIITRLSILTHPKMPAVNLAFLACQDFLMCQSLMVRAKRELGGILSAFEFLDRESLDLVIQHVEGVRNPFDSLHHSFYLLIETAGSDHSRDRERLESFLSGAVESALLADAVVAQDLRQASSFWHLRASITEALMKAGAVYKYDLSLPVPYIYDLVELVKKRLTGRDVRVIGYGHLGDGNLHLNISAPRYDPCIERRIEPFVYEWTSAHGGSVSAEHGLGVMKADEIWYTKPPQVVNLMVSVKNLFDPSGILNPYKLLPRSIKSR